MQQIEHTTWLPYSPQTLYDALADPQALAAVIGRIKEIHVVSREGNEGQVAVTLDLPARKTVETVGSVVGVPYQQLSFRTREPFPLEFAWIFHPQEREGKSGTEVQTTLGLDLSAFGLPVPGIMVRGLIQSELKEDMDRLEAWLKKQQG
jgi:hypothetical protein